MGSRAFMCLSFIKKKKNPRLRTLKKLQNRAHTPLSLLCHLGIHSHVLFLFSSLAYALHSTYLY